LFLSPATAGLLLVASPFPRLKAVGYSLLPPTAAHEGLHTHADVSVLTPLRYLIASCAIMASWVTRLNLARWASNQPAFRTDGDIVVA
jgi:hypothetical protein